MVVEGARNLWSTPDCSTYNNNESCNETGGIGEPNTTRYLPRCTWDDSSKTCISTPLPPPLETLVSKKCPRPNGNDCPGHVMLGNEPVEWLPNDKITPRMQWCLDCINNSEDLTDADQRAHCRDSERGCRYPSSNGYGKQKYGAGNGGGYDLWHSRLKALNYLQY